MTKYGRLKPVAGGQLGAFTQSQANALGITTRELRSRVQSGILDKSGVRTYRDPLTMPTPLAELHAVVLDVGEPCWVSGATAAALYSFDGFRLTRPFHLLLPRGRSVVRAGVEIHTSVEIPSIDCERRERLPVLSPTRTLIDIAATESPARLTAAVDGAIRDGLTSEDHLIRRIVALRTKGRYGLPTLIRVIEGSEATRGGHSWLEREYLKLSKGARLPKPTTQKILSRAGDRLIRVDCHYPGTRLVVELLGYKWHRSKEQMRRDAERMNALQLDGFVVLQFTTVHLVEQPDWVMETVRAALTSLCVSGSARIRRIG
jgi:very-short-patch-repair endonuclease